MLDQFRTRALVISTIRVSLTQASSILTKYTTDQLEQETKTEELIVQGDLTEEEANRKNDEWEKTEWSRRWSTYPPDALKALLRFHAVTILMRVSELVLSYRVSKELMDKLTRETFKAAISKSENGVEGKEMRVQMFGTCLWANLVAFGSDWGVQQVALTYGYYIYHQKKKQKRMEQQQQQAKKKNSLFQSFFVKTKDEKKELDNDGAGGGMMLSLAVRSTKLVVLRFAALVMASAGGALGSQFKPGWGTLIGTSMGDGLLAAILD